MVRANRATNAQRELSRAKNIKSNLGARAAAGYMRNRGWSLEAALWNLCKQGAR